MTDRLDSVQDTRQLISKHTFAILSTILPEEETPFGSVVPYCLDENGRPVLYVSVIAEHTKNLKLNGNCSLFLLDNYQHDLLDIQEHLRVTLICETNSSSDTLLQERYFRYFPAAKQFQNSHDFKIIILNIKKIRVIGGYGRIYWVAPEDVCVKGFSLSDEKEQVELLNNNFQEMVSAFCKLNKLIPSGLKVAGFNRESIDLLSENRKFNIKLPKSINSAAEIIKVIEN